MSAFLLPEHTAVVETATTTASYVPFTGWVPGDSARRAKLRLIGRNFGGNMKVTTAYQRANTDTDAPNAWTKIASGSAFLTADGKLCTGEVDLNAVAEWGAALRFGVAVENTSGTAWSRAEVSLLVATCSTP